MGPRSFARAVCALGVLWGSLTCCGARSALDSNDYAASGAAGAAEAAAGAGPFIDPAICSRFAPLWDSRAGATTLLCDTCLHDVGCGWPSDATCVRGTRCVDRRCSVLGDLSSLCTCIESCFSSAERECGQRWATFMSCASSACKDACP